MLGDLITIARCASVHEAYLAKSELAAFGIDAFLTDAHTISANWLWSNALGGVKIQVLESQVQEAMDVLESAANREPPAEEVPTDSGEICPTCSSANTRFFLNKRGSFLTWLVLGFPVIPSFTKHVCLDCGARFKIQDPALAHSSMAGRGGKRDGLTCGTFSARDCLTLPGGQACGAGVSVGLLGARVRRTSFRSRR